MPRHNRPDIERFFDSVEQIDLRVQHGKGKRSVPLWVWTGSYDRTRNRSIFCAEGWRFSAQRWLYYQVTAGKPGENLRFGWLGDEHKLFALLNKPTLEAIHEQVDGLTEKDYGVVKLTDPTRIISPQFLTMNYHGDERDRFSSGAVSSPRNPELVIPSVTNHKQRLAMLKRLQQGDRWSDVLMDYDLE